MPATFTPEGNRDVYPDREDSLRIFLKERHVRMSASLAAGRL